MTNQDLLRIAMKQSAIDAGCCPEDFTCTENVVVISTANQNARKYLTLPFYCNFIDFVDKLNA